MEAAAEKLMSDDELMQLLADITPAPVQHEPRQIIPLHNAQAEVIPMPAPVAQPTASAPKKKAGKLDLSGIAVKKKAEDKQTEYPVLPDPNLEVALYADAFLVAHA